MAANDKCKINTIEALLALDRQDDKNEKTILRTINLKALGLTDLDMQAYIDGELTGEKAEKLEKLLPFYPLLQERCEELKAQNEMLKAWWAVKKKQH